MMVKISHSNNIFKCTQKTITLTQRPVNDYTCCLMGKFGLKSNFSKYGSQTSHRIFSCIGGCYWKTPLLWNWGLEWWTWQELPCCYLIWSEQLWKTSFVVYLHNVNWHTRWAQAFSCESQEYLPWNPNSAHIRYQNWKYFLLQFWC